MELKNITLILSIFCMIWIVQIEDINIVLRIIVLWILFLLQESIFSVIFSLLKQKQELSNNSGSIYIFW